jgi:hypothetical protein
MNHSTPIKDALIWLRDTTRLTKPECDAILEALPTAYRTYGDLVPHVFDREELPKDLLAKLRQVLPK